MIALTRKLFQLACTTAIVGAMCGIACTATAVTVIKTAVKDNTLYQHASGLISNGAGEMVFSGRTGADGGNRILRALVAFDLASIPPGSTITSAKFTVFLAQSHTNNMTHTVHRVLANWGEGTSIGDTGEGAPSTTNDATWLHRFYPSQLWSSPGGDFVAASSASTSIGMTTAFYTWSSAGLISDVQGWVNNPSTNFGWIVRGNETSTGTAKKLASRNISDAQLRPKLEIEYTPPQPCSTDFNQDYNIGVPDLLVVIANWGQCSPPPSSCIADVAPAGGDGAVGVPDLLAIIAAWGSCPAP